MPLAEEMITGSYSIQAYETGQVTVNEEIYKDSIVLSSDTIISPWPVSRVEDLSLQDLKCVVDLKPEVVLLGTGQKQKFPDMGIIGYFAQLGLGLEIMDNAALYRTFNILAAEDRQVVAAIIQSID